MNVYFFRGFIVTNHAIIMKIGLFGSTFFVSQRPIEGVSDTIYHGSLHHIPGGIGVDNDTTINSTRYLFNVGMAVSYDHIYYMSCIRVMTEISCYPTLFSCIFGFSPT